MSGESMPDTSPTSGHEPRNRRNAIWILINIALPVILLAISALMHSSLHSKLLGERSRTETLQGSYQQLGNPNLDQQDLTARQAHANEMLRTLRTLLTSTGHTTPAVDIVIEHYAAVSGAQFPTLSLTSWSQRRDEVRTDSPGPENFALTLLGYASDLLSLEAFLARLEADPLITVRFERANQEVRADGNDPYAFHLELDVRSESPRLEARIP